MPSDGTPDPQIAQAVREWWAVIATAAAALIGYGRLSRRLESIDGPTGALVRMQGEITALRSELASDRKAGEESRRRVWAKLDQIATDLRSSDEALRDDLREDVRELRAVIQVALASRSTD
ncbi:hypothetical protein [Albimonas pacifica]|uniref:Uncharacterized protein n=1 Tax=Albimonas pacifica TaxID=1114924 RepID=A0A1I3P6T9_9RHOB|nr:hypothetical protein [Albimonas pacifica]SFJ17101.1 hypothetical protein SAMN05216258_11583 [Albimonas pacifica]